MQGPTCVVAAGWLDGEPSKLTGRFEIRPAAEQGPIIVCLDTSGAALDIRCRAVGPELVHSRVTACFISDASFRPSAGSLKAFFILLHRVYVGVSRDSGEGRSARVHA